MSQCFRSTPNRLATYFYPRKQMMQVDRRLPKHTKRCVLIQKRGPLPVNKPNIYELAFPTSNQWTTVIHGGALRSYFSTCCVSRGVAAERDVDKHSKDVSETEKSSGPTPKQLEHVYNTLRNDLPRFFVASIDYRIYHRDVEFVNNLKERTTKGINNYIKQVLYLRVGAHVTYAYVKFDVLKITMHPEDNTVKVRWRIRGLSGLKVFSMFWKFRLFNAEESSKGMESWHDGFSTYYVGSDGLIYKHVADKMMPDDETLPIKNKSPIAAKLAA